MTHTRLKFLLEHFHCNHTTEFDLTEEDEEIEDNTEELVLVSTEWVHREQEFNNQNEESDVQENTTDIPDNVNARYEKVEPLVNNVRERSMNLIFTLGTILAPDEMMIRFMGRSHETHRIKNKPIKEGNIFLF